MFPALAAVLLRRASSRRFRAVLNAAGCQGTLLTAEAIGAWLESSQRMVDGRVCYLSRSLTGEVSAMLDPVKLFASVE